MELENKAYWAVNRMNMGVDEAGKKRKLDIQEWKKSGMMHMKTKPSTKRKQKLSLTR